MGLEKFIRAAVVGLGLTTGSGCDVENVPAPDPKEVVTTEAAQKQPRDRFERAEMGFDQKRLERLREILKVKEVAQSRGVDLGNKFSYGKTRGEIVKIIDGSGRTVYEKEPAIKGPIFSEGVGIINVEVEMSIPEIRSKIAKLEEEGSLFSESDKQSGTEEVKPKNIPTSPKKTPSTAGGGSPKPEARTSSDISDFL